MGITTERVRRLSVAAAAGIALAIGLRAGEPASTTPMPSMTVTATRTNGSNDLIGGSTVSIITSEQVEARGLVTVEEALKAVPGITVAATGGPGSVSSVFTRGMPSEHTLVLVDGIMLNDPSSSSRAANLATLTVDNIEQIEVVRGPLSSLYGSNASGGVVNIITKRGAIDAPHVHVGIEGGSHNTWRVYTGASGANDWIDYSTALSRTKTGGISMAGDDNSSIPHAGNTDEDDGWENITASGTLGITLTPDAVLRLTGRYQDSTVEDDEWGPGYMGDRFAGAWVEVNPGDWQFLATPVPDGPNEAHSESTEILGRVSLETVHLDGLLESTVYGQVTRIARRSYDNDDVLAGDYRGDTQEFGWQGGLNIEDVTRITLGVSRFQESMDGGFAGFAPVDEDTYMHSVWAQNQLFVVDGLDVVTGVRVDDHEEFGSHASWRIAPAYTFEPTGTTIKGSVGTGFRAPSLFKLYSDYGNRNLDPEESTGWDVGLVQRLFEEEVEVGATYFETVIDDLIDYDYGAYNPNTGSNGMYNQVDGETETRGIEVYALWQILESLAVHGSYTYTDTEAPDGSRLVRRPLHKVFTGATYRWRDKVTLSADVLWCSERDTISSAADAGGNPVSTMEDYTVVNVSAAYDITENVRIYGRVDNVFDEEYEEAWSYGTPGLSAYGGVRISF